jgi:hypothetical protein
MDASVVHQGDGSPCTVHQVRVEVTDAAMIVHVTVVVHHAINKGHKFIVDVQKATVDALIATVSLPFTEDGTVPDCIIGVHSFGGRKVGAAQAALGLIFLPGRWCLSQQSVQHACRGERRAHAFGLVSARAESRAGRTDEGARVRVARVCAYA